MRIGRAKFDEDAFFDLKISKERWENKLAEPEEAMAPADGELAALERHRRLHAGYERA